MQLHLPLTGVALISSAFLAAQALAVPKPLDTGDFLETTRPRGDLVCAPGERLVALGYQDFANPTFADFTDNFSITCEDSAGTQRVVRVLGDEVGNATPENVLACASGEIRGVGASQVRLLGRWALDAATPLCGNALTPAPNPDLDPSAQTYVPVACPAGSPAIGLRYVDREDYTGTFSDPADAVTVICDCPTRPSTTTVDPQLSVNPKPRIRLECDAGAGEIVVGVVTDGHTRNDGTPSDLSDGVGIVCAPRHDPSQTRVLWPAEVDVDPSDDDYAVCANGLAPVGVGYLEQGARGRVDAVTALCGPAAEPLLTADLLDDNINRDPTGGDRFFTNRCQPGDILVGIEYADSYTATNLGPDPVDAVTVICIPGRCL